MPSDYRNLATIHNEIGMGDFARQMTGHLINYAQQHNWLGRHILDLGCGTGESLRWLTQHGYIVSGVDSSPEMLSIAHQTPGTRDAAVQMVTGDIRTVTDFSDQDMVLALNVLNELNNIRELEQTFKNIHGMLRDDKWFVFDFYTVEGLYRRNESGFRLEHDADDLTIMIRNEFDYEKSIQTRRYIIFRRKDNSWHRYEANRVLRSYAVQGVTALLKRNGFKVNHVLNLNMNEYNPADSAERVIIFAEKQ